MPKSITISAEWTPEERLRLIAELAAIAETAPDMLTLRQMACYCRMLATQRASSIEMNREFIFRDAGLIDEDRAQGGASADIR